MKGQQAALGALVAAVFAVAAWRTLQDSPEEAVVSMALAADMSTVQAVQSPPAKPVSTAGRPTPPSEGPAAPVQAPAPATRVPMSFEHQKMIDMGKGDDGGDDLHAMFEREPRDNPAWAYETEAYLRGLYDEAGAEIYSLECRSKTCEVQAFADAGITSSSVMEVSSQVDMHRLLSMGFSFPVNGRQPVLMYYTRYVRSKPTEAQKEGERRRREIVESLKAR